MKLFILKRNNVSNSAGRVWCVCVKVRNIIFIVTRETHYGYARKALSEYICLSNDSIADAIVDRIYNSELPLEILGNVQCRGAWTAESGFRNFWKENNLHENES